MFNIYCFYVYQILIYSSIELSIDGILALIFCYTSYESKDLANEFNDSIGLFLSGLILNIFLYNSLNILNLFIYIRCSFNCFRF